MNGKEWWHMNVSDDTSADSYLGVKYIKMITSIMISYQVADIDEVVIDQSLTQPLTD
jgi:hypothetical protein